MIMCMCVNLLRRHERPVLGEAVSIVHLDDELVVVHKPPSVPVSCLLQLQTITTGSNCNGGGER